MLEVAAAPEESNHFIEIVSEDTRTTATEINSDMITVAKIKVAADRVEWQVADAQKLFKILLLPFAITLRSLLPSLAWTIH